MKLKFELVLLPVLLAGCVTTPAAVRDANLDASDELCTSIQSGAAYESESIVQSRSSSKMIEADGFLTVHIVVDAKSEKLPFETSRQRKKIEATSMLRTWKCLQAKYPGLGNRRIASRRVKNSFDDDTGCYFYSTSFKVSDIEKALKKK